MSDSTITIAMASFPPRRTGMIRAVGELLPQCDRLCLYLNNYDAVPAELPKSEKLEVILAGSGREFPDKGSQGKLHWIGLCSGYYLTVDDDILYPPDYASSIVAGIEKYGRKAIVGYHGSVFKLANGVPTPRPRFMRDHRTLYMYTRGERADIPVHMIGNGTMGCYPSALGLSYDTVCCGELHSGDDEDVAIWAQSNGVCLIRLAGKTNWLRPDMTVASASPLHSRTEFMTKADAKLRSCQKWRLNPVNSEDRISVNNTISRNTNLVNARSVVQRRPSRPSAVNRAANRPNNRVINRVVNMAATRAKPNEPALPDVQSLISKVPPVSTGFITDSKSIVIAMATFPPRRNGFVRVVKDLLPQCDKMYVYMNGYTEIPEELPKSDKLQLVLAGPGCEHPDLGSHGKFYWTGLDDGYYLTVDDDIIYPSNYCAEIVAGIDKYGKTAIVGYHGGIYAVNNSGNAAGSIQIQKRTLYGYSSATKNDMVVHVLGCGVMGCVPSAIGLSYGSFSGSLHSGDDEDLAIWAQIHNVPLIRLSGNANWICPNDGIWKINPLHKRNEFIHASNKKLAVYRGWRLLELPMNGPKTTLIKAKKPAGPCLDHVELSNADIEFCEKIMSSDALAALLVDRIKKRVPTSVIRTSDGERACIDHFKTGRLTGFLKDAGWLARYGLTGADLKQVGKDLLWAGENADYLACTISGLFWDIFKVHDYFPGRPRFVDQFYPQIFAATDRVGAVLRAGPVLVLHREHDKIVPVLEAKYALDATTGMKLDSWKDQAGLLESLVNHPASTVLVSGGPSGKPFCVRLAERTGKVVLDVGEALTGCWLGTELSQLAKQREHKYVLG